VTVPEQPRLLLIAGKDPADEPGGGHSLYVRAHALAATAAGYRPTLVAVAPRGGSYEAPFGTVHRTATRWRPIRQLAIPVLERPLRQAVVELAGEGTGPVLVHGFGVWGAAAVSGVAALRAAGVPAAAAVSSYTVYRVEHESLVRGAGDEPLVEQFRYRRQALWASTVVGRWERRGYRGADRVWANYASVRAMLHEHHGADLQVDLIPYGPESAFEPLPTTSDGGEDVWPARSDRLRLVCVSRHHSRKGVDVLIDALALLAADRVVVDARLVGRGPLVDAHRRRVTERGLDGSVVVTGGVDTVEPYLRGADLYVLPSREEQSGALALLEAQRLGLAAIASAVDGIPEDVTDGETGILVPPGDATALAAAIRSLVVDAGLRARLGAAGQQRFDERFSAAAFTEGLADAYADLLTCAAAPAPGRR
jgi:glycosyltransferase involved in cell wall biosynthesis